MEILQAESHSKSLWLPLCAHTLRLTLIHRSVNAILYSHKFSFPAVKETERDRLFSHLSCILTGSSTANRGDDLGNGFFSTE